MSEESDLKLELQAVSSETLWKLVTAEQSLQPRKWFLTVRTVMMQAAYRMSLSFPRDTGRNQRAAKQECCGSKLGSRCLQPRILEAPDPS